MPPPKESLTKALSLAPENAIAHLLLGVVQMHTDPALQGIRSCERALDLDRNLAAAHAQIGDCKSVLGRPEETEAHIQEALRLSPRDRDVYLWCMFAGLARFQLGREEEAVVWLRRSIEADRNLSELTFHSGGRSGRISAGSPKRGPKLRRDWQ